MNLKRRHYKKKSCRKFEKRKKATGVTFANKGNNFGKKELKKKQKYKQQLRMRRCKSISKKAIQMIEINHIK